MSLVKYSLGLCTFLQQDPGSHRAQQQRGECQIVMTGAAAHSCARLPKGSAGCRTPWPSPRDPREPGQRSPAPPSPGPRGVVPPDRGEHPVGALNAQECGDPAARQERLGPAGRAEWGRGRRLWRLQENTERERPRREGRGWSESRSSAWTERGLGSPEGGGREKCAGARRFPAVARRRNGPQRPGLRGARVSEEAVNYMRVHT